MDTRPSFSRQDVEKIIKNICKQEFDIDVKVAEIGDTVWIYAPFEKVLNKENKFDEKVLEKVRHIFLSTNRAFLSMDKPPLFYCFVISDIKSIGADWYFIGFFYDMMKLQTNFISLGEAHEREVILNFFNPQALGDAQGSHIVKYDITMGEFIALLIKRDIENAFSATAIKDKVTINDIRTYCDGEKLGILFNIVNKQYDPNMPNPFEVAKKSAKKFLKIYDNFQKIVEVEINDTGTKKSRTFSKRALFEDEN
jgi:hypothetical protein